MELKILKEDFSICKISDISKVNFESKYCFLGKTDEEISLVCTSDSVPANHTECDNGWKALKIDGVLDFSLVGILSKISTVLAENKIGIFAISTFNTDYILIKKENLNLATESLKKASYSFLE